MPEEGDPHARTWMAFGAGERIWGPRLLPQARRDLVLIATTIARFEPVSMLARPEDMDLARGLIGAANIELIAAPVDDVWIRDTGPVFHRTDSGWGGADFNFNGWGDKQEHHRDAKVAEFVAARAGVQMLHTDLVLEGGGIEVDGQGTAIITESCVLNADRNFYVCNGAVIAPEFGDPRSDGAAKATLERLFPDRQVVQINIDAIAAGGGGIHCTTQQEPAR